MAVRKTLSTVCLAGFAVIALGATGVAVPSNSEAVVRQGFSAALIASPAQSGEFQGMAAALAKTKLAKAAASKAPVSGSEEFWLSSERSDTTIAVTKAVAVGDRIMMSLGGKDIRLEVADVTEFAPQVTAIDTRDGHTRYLMVTARDTASAVSQPVRFVLEVEQAAPGKLPGKSEHAS